MNKTRKTKLTIIIAFVVAISAMSIGFAAFSSMLTISSSATVTPDGNLNLKIYTLTTLQPEDFTDFSSFTTTQKNISPLITLGGASGSEAIIDEDNFAISNLQANFINPGALVSYFAVIRNEGVYTAYLNLNNYIRDSDGYLMINKTCIPEEGTAEELVKASCDYIKVSNNAARLSDEQNSWEALKYADLEDGYYKINPNDYIIIMLTIQYDSDAVLADGPFTVNFDDIKAEFTTAGPTEQNE